MFKFLMWSRLLLNYLLEKIVNSITLYLFIHKYTYLDIQTYKYLGKSLEDDTMYFWEFVLVSTYFCMKLYKYFCITIKLIELSMRLYQRKKLCGDKIFDKKCSKLHEHHTIFIYLFNKGRHIFYTFIDFGKILYETV